ncbi:MAG: hypothetical protein H6817_02595 [Phycisphaerales bacterium]|nr:hypothetical protein [Phycisphaerales bacterium]
MHDAYLVFSKNDDALFTTDQVGTQVISVRVDLTTGKVSQRPVELEEAHRVGFEASGDARLSQTTCLLNRHPSTQESGRRILLSPNGRKPATLDPDGTVRCVGPCVAGRPVSLGGADGVRIVNPDTGVEDQQVRSLPGVLVHALAYSPIGRLFAAGTNDGRVFLLDTQFHEIGFEFQAHPPGRDFVGRQPDYPQYQYIRDVRWSPDGTMLITASGDGTVCVWDARRLAERRRQRESHVKRTAAMRESSATHATSEILHDPSMPAEDRSAARIVAIESWSATARSSELWRSAQQDN